MNFLKKTKRSIFFKDIRSYFIKKRSEQVDMDIIKKSFKQTKLKDEEDDEKDEDYAPPS